ncbi:MAG: hypothetical protein QNJ54_16330 [Prochloraceae cyanobacterium]|nr:hypothetical protein [Prochloraceae cyanobacterium]
MDYTNINKILLSLILALRDLEESLNEEEEKAIATAGRKLRTEVEYWEKAIEPDLLATIEKNPKLSERFKYYKSKLDRIYEKNPDILFPTDEYLNSIANTPQTPAKLSLPKETSEDRKRERNSKEIINMATEVMTKKPLTQTAKKINFLQTIKDFIDK